MHIILPLYVILALLIFLRACRNYYRLRQNIRWITGQAAPDGSSSRNNPTFVICLPVYLEQDILAETLAYFSKLHYPKSNYKIVVVTTEKEGKGKGTTYQLAMREARRINKAYPGLVTVVHYPKKRGAMAHQINYAAACYADNLKRTACYFTVYNADSRPNIDTLNWISAAVRRHRRTSEQWPTILQQSTLYKTVAPGKPTISSHIASGAAIHQSLWTLIQELTRFRKQSESVTKLTSHSGLIDMLRFSRISHCVGHGLYIQGSHFLNSPLPEDLMNEDLPYGLVQCCNRQPIIPVPVMELGQSPNQLKNVYRQKMVWFNPLFDFKNCAHTIIRNRLYMQKFEAKYLLFQAYLLLIMWLLRTAMWTILFLLAGLLGWIYLLLAVMLFVLHWIVPALTYRQFVRQTGIEADSSLSSILWGSLYAVTDSIGPMWCVYNHAAAKLARTTPDKPKTANR